MEGYQLSLYMKPVGKFSRGMTTHSIPQTTFTDEA